MTQREIDKLLGAAIRDSAKDLGWKSSRGFIFRATDLLFFSIVVIAQARRDRLYYSFGFKLLAFDDLLWKIARVDENQKQPLGFRAFGALTAPSTEVVEAQLPMVEWTEHRIRSGVQEAITRCEPEAERIAREVVGPAENLALIERIHARSQEKYPAPDTRIWRERLLTAILEADRPRAEDIVRERLAVGDDGGIYVGGASFYNLACEFLQKTP